MTNKFEKTLIKRRSVLIYFCGELVENRVTSKIINKAYLEVNSKINELVWRDEQLLEEEQNA